MDQSFDSRSQRRLVGQDRLRTWTLILIMSGVNIALVAVAALAGSGVAYVVMYAYLGLAGVFVWIRRRAKLNTAQVERGTVTLTGHRSSFSNVAFSTRAPSWYGWRRDVGLLRIHDHHVSIQGLRGSITITPPMRAVVEERRHGHWPFVKVTGRVDQARGVEVFLGVRGYPRSKFAASEDEIAAETRALCAAINLR